MLSASPPESSTAVVVGDGPRVEANDGLDRASPGRLGRYEVLGRLGRGGMADVYLALSTSPVGDVHKLVVIKRVREVLQDDPHFIRMFLEEARVSARINHPNVVHTYAVEVDAGVPLIVMEYLDGVALSALARPLADGSWRDRLPLVWALSQALIGLHHVHEFRDFDGQPLGLVHRDIKPANIFVTFEGQVKVLDFGVAKSTAVSDTASQAIKGTARYMAPEMVAEGLAIDRRADIFACGVVLGEILTGKPLWQNVSPLQILRRLADNDVPSIAWKDTGIPDELASICRRALQADPAARHATAAELRHEIEAFLRTQPDAPTGETLAAIVVHNYDEQRQQRARTIRERVASKGSGDRIEEWIPLIWTPGSQSEPRPAPSRRSWIGYAVVGVAALGLAAVAYAVGAGGSPPAEPGAPATNAVVEPSPAAPVVEHARVDVGAAPAPVEVVEAEVVDEKPTRAKPAKPRPRKSKATKRSDKLELERESPW